VIVLVTGGAGYIGSVTADALVDIGPPVGSLWVVVLPTESTLLGQAPPTGSRWISGGAQSQPIQVSRLHEIGGDRSQVRSDGDDVNRNDTDGRRVGERTDVCRLTAHGTRRASLMVGRYGGQRAG
jgi:nucleoside-diphosphate-sugar epimerase